MLRLHKYKKLHQSKYSKDKEVKIQNFHISFIFLFSLLHYYIILHYSCIILTTSTFFVKIYSILWIRKLFGRLEQSNVSFREGLIILY